MRQIRMLRARRRELEPGLRPLLLGHAGGNPGDGQGVAYGLPRQFPTLPGGILTQAALVGVGCDRSRVVKSEMSGEGEGLRTSVR